MTRPALKRNDILYPELSYQIVGSAFSVYNELGAGHHEKYYQRALAIELKKRGIVFVEQASFPLQYKEEIVGRGQLDYLIDGKIVVEIKKGDGFSKRHIDQVLSYLKFRTYAFEPTFVEA